MKKSEYMQELHTALQPFEEETRNEIISNYEDHFQMGLQEGKMEEALVLELGSIDELVEELKQIQDSEKRTLRKKDDESNLAMQVSVSDLPDKKAENLETENKGENDREACSRIVLEPMCANIKLTRSQDKKLHISYRNLGNEKQQKLYRFYHYQEGETVYAGVKKSDFSSWYLQSFITPHIVFEVEVPAGMKSVEVKGLSGDIECFCVDSASLILSSLSGSLKIEQIIAEDLVLKTASGDLSIRELEVKNTAHISSKSGSITMDLTYGNKYRASTMSGDLNISNSRYSWAECRSISGDTNLHQVFSDTITAGSTSGDVNAKDLNGICVEGNSKSGDVNITSNAREIKANSISGDVKAVGSGNVTAILSSVSGDASFEFNTPSGGYRASVQSVSGSVYLSYNGEKIKAAKRGSHVFGNGEADLRLKTVSGDIKIRG